MKHNNGLSADKVTKRNDTHSEKVREILSDMPQGIARWGIWVICVIFVVIFAIVLSAEYPYGHGETIFDHIFR